MLTGLLFLAALALSAASAYFAISGLTVIFAGAVLAVAIVGGLIEGSKLVLISWLYRNWKQAPWRLKLPLSGLLLTLMLLTSMGVYGFLTKAHVEHGTPMAAVSAQLKDLDDQVASHTADLIRIRADIAAIDKISASALERTDNIAGVNRAFSIRRQQAADRTILQADARKAQDAIAALNTQRTPLLSQMRTAEAEVGPLKYVAALFTDNPSNDDLERAVRWMILLLVATLDPLAILMLTAANWSLRQRPTKPTDIPPPTPPQPTTELLMSPHPLRGWSYRTVAPLLSMPQWSPSVTARVTPPPATPVRAVSVAERLPEAVIVPPPAPVPVFESTSDARLMQTPEALLVAEPIAETIRRADEVWAPPVVHDHPAEPVTDETDDPVLLPEPEPLEEDACPDDLEYIQLEGPTGNPSFLEPDPDTPATDLIPPDEPTLHTPADEEAELNIILPTPYHPAPEAAPAAAIAKVVNLPNPPLGQFGQWKTA
jgi:hypothetical protein